LIIATSLGTLHFIEKIHQASNGQQALDMVMENEIPYSKGDNRFYDIIFLDLGMPIKDGY
jgi:CheY-like chemotaxis protein